MRVISGKGLRRFQERHPEVALTLQAWRRRAEQAQWLSPQEVKNDYPSASILSGDRVVFNIKGNHYRLVAQIHYDTGHIYVRFIGTHAEYDRINATEV